MRWRNALPCPHLMQNHLFIFSNHDDERHHFHFERKKKKKKERRYSHAINTAKVVIIVEREKGKGRITKRKQTDGQLYYDWGTADLNESPERNFFFLLWRNIIYITCWGDVGHLQKKLSRESHHRDVHLVDVISVSLKEPNKCAVALFYEKIGITSTKRARAADLTAEKPQKRQQRTLLPLSLSIEANPLGPFSCSPILTASSRRRIVARTGKSNQLLIIIANCLLFSREKLASF